MRVHGTNIETKINNNYNGREKELRKFKQQFYEPMRSRVETFDLTSGVVAFIEENVNKAWEHAEGELEKHYVESFYGVNPVKGLCYLNKYVTAENTVDFDLKTFDIKSKLNYHNVSTKEIEILKSFIFLK